MVRLHRDSRALVEALADRLPAETLARLRVYSDVGEWGELLEELRACVAKRQIPLTPDERDLLASI